MKKVSIVVLIILIAITGSVLQNVYATTIKSEKMFFEVNKKEISINDTLEMIINTDKINFNKFKFTLSANLDINTIYNEDEELEIEKENDDIVLEIDKTKINLDKIVLYYTIPEETEIGSELILKAVAENMESETNKEISENTMIENEIAETDTEIENANNVVENTVIKDNVYIIESETCEITVKIIENDEKNEDTNQEDKIEGENKPVDSLVGNKKEENIESTPTTSFSNVMPNTSKTSNSGTVQTVTYNGSCNNYLASLNIDGYELNKEFNKESSTYFITVDNTVSNLSITAVTEDENAVLCMYGADNLKEGENKVLISITAENGNVRNYRIYVTKES